MEEKGPLAPGVSAKEIEARLVEIYDRIKVDMESMRQNLENSQKALEKEMAAVRSSIADHDQVIRTYFVRVVETFGVFVGIFAVVGGGDHRHDRRGQLGPGGCDRLLTDNPGRPADHTCGGDRLLAVCRPGACPEDAPDPPGLRPPQYLSNDIKIASSRW